MIVSKKIGEEPIIYKVPAKANRMRHPTTGFSTEGVGSIYHNI